MATGNAQSLHLLSIDLASAPGSLRAVLELGPEDVTHWLAQAAAAGVPLAIVCGPSRIDMYSTEGGRRAAFKPLLESLGSLGRNLEGFERVRTTESNGQAVMRHLLRQATGLESTEHGLSYAGCIAQASQQAALHGTLDAVLRELFQLATTTAHRSHAETELQAPHSTRASRQIEALGAERILEEELMAFRLAAEDDEDLRENGKPSLPPPPRYSSMLPAFGASEPGSVTRLRVEPFNLLPASKRSSG